MKDADLGYDKTLAHNMSLTSLEGNCIDIMRSRGEGVAAAIPAGELADALGLAGDESGDDGKRSLRTLINHLIMTHLHPIICQAGRGGGYYLTGTRAETEQFRATFIARGKTGLFKASCARRAAYVDIVYQYSLGFDDEPGAAPKSRGVINHALTLDDGPPVWVQVVSKCLDRAAADPEKYAQELRALQEKYGDIFVPRETVRQLREETAKFQQLLSRVTAAY